MFKLLRLLIVIIVLVGAGAMFLPLGSVEYKDPEMKGTLIVPSFSMFDGEVMNSNGDYVANFQSVRSEWALSQEFERMLNEKYTEIVCSDGKTAYLDSNNHIILKSYVLQGSFPLSKYSVSYGIGDSC